MLLNDAQAALPHFTLLATLAERLASQSRAIYHHHFDYLSFGSWQLIAGVRRRRTQITWDGRDHTLSASLAVFADSQSRPPWQPISEQRLGPGDDARLFGLVEQLVLEHTTK